MSVGLQTTATQIIENEDRTEDRKFQKLSMYGEVQGEEVLTDGDQHPAGHHHPADAWTVGVHGREG